MGKFTNGCTKAWTGTKKFFKENWQSILVVGGQIGVTAGIGYGLYKLSTNQKERYEAGQQAALEVFENRNYETKADICERVRTELEERYDFKSFTDYAKSLDLKDGDALIVAAPGSEYNSNDEGTDVMIVNKDGWYTYLNDEES